MVYHAFSIEPAIDFPAIVGKFPYRYDVERIVDLNVYEGTGGRRNSFRKL